eukprot:1975377-Rhodomonas_salina.1
MPRVGRCHCRADLPIVPHENTAIGRRVGLEADAFDHKRRSTLCKSLSGGGCHVQPARQEAELYSPMQHRHFSRSSVVDRNIGVLRREDPGRRGTDHRGRRARADLEGVCGSLGSREPTEVIAVDIEAECVDRQCRPAQRTPVDGRAARKAGPHCVELERTKHVGCCAIQPQRSMGQ